MYPDRHTWAQFLLRKFPTLNPAAKNAAYDRQQEEKQLGGAELAALREFWRAWRYYHEGNGRIDGNVPLTDEMIAHSNAAHHRFEAAKRVMLAFDSAEVTLDA